VASLLTGTRGGGDEGMRGGRAQEDAAAARVGGDAARETTYSREQVDLTSRNEIRVGSENGDETS